MADTAGGSPRSHMPERLVRAMQEECAEFFGRTGEREQILGMQVSVDLVRINLRCIGRIDGERRTC